MNEWKDSALKKNIKTKALQSKSRKQQTLLGVSVHEVDRKKNKWFALKPHREKVWGLNLIVGLGVFMRSVRVGALISLHYPKTWM